RLFSQALALIVSDRIKLAGVNSRVTKFNALTGLAQGFDSEAANDHLAVREVAQPHPIGMNGRAINRRDKHPFDAREVNAAGVPDCLMVGEVLARDDNIGLVGVGDPNKSIPNILTTQRPHMEWKILRPAGVVYGCALNGIATLREALGDFVSDATEARRGHEITEP